MREDLLSLVEDLFGGDIDQAIQHFEQKAGAPGIDRGQLQHDIHFLKILKSESSQSALSTQSQYVQPGLLVVYSSQ